VNGRPERLADLLPEVIADLAARHGRVAGLPTHHTPTRSHTMTDNPQPRVWFDDEDIPCGVHVLTERGEIRMVGDDEELPGEPCRMIGFGPLVEVILPDHSAAVAAEKARRGGAA
jgi:hypothetical protein